MSDPLIGTVQIQDANKVTTIVLDGAKGAVAAGSTAARARSPSPHGYDGQVFVTNAKGVQCANLAASEIGGSLVLNYHDGTPCLALGRGFQLDPGPSLFMLDHVHKRVTLHGVTAGFTLGGNGADAQIGLFAAGTDHGPYDKANIHLRATDAVVRAGGAGTAGRIRVFGKGGTDKSEIDLDGATGNIRATGDIFLSGADVGEDFDVCVPESADPGTVMVIDKDGTLRNSEKPYDTKVAGVVSGAGAYKPGIVLDKQRAATGRLTLALVGKVFCKVDAEEAAIEVGDLLTTSQVPGHAMKAVDSKRAFGCVIGKALRPLTNGRGLIPILIALQ